MASFPTLPPNFDEDANQRKISKAGRIPQPAFKVSRDQPSSKCVLVSWVLSEKPSYLGFNRSILRLCHALRSKPNSYSGLFSLSTVSWRLFRYYCHTIPLRRNWPGLCFLSKHFRHSGRQRGPIHHHTAWSIQWPCTDLCHSWIFPVYNVDVHFRCQIVLPSTFSNLDSEGLEGHHEILLDRCYDNHCHLDVFGRRAFYSLSLHQPRTTTESVVSPSRKTIK